VLKYIAIVLLIPLLVFLALQVKRMNFAHYSDNKTLSKINNLVVISKLNSLTSLIVEKLNSSSSSIANELLLEEVRESNTIVISYISKRFKIVNMIFYDRKNRVEILNCYLKIKAYKKFYNINEKLKA